jgi:hypothetical protein
LPGSGEGVGESVTAAYAGTTAISTISTIRTNVRRRIERDGSRSRAAGQGIRGESPVSGDGACRQTDPRGLNQTLANSTSVFSRPFATLSRQHVPVYAKT